MVGHTEAACMAGLRAVTGSEAIAEHLTSYSPQLRAHKLKCHGVPWLNLSESTQGLQMGFFLRQGQ